MTVFSCLPASSPTRRRAGRQAIALAVARKLAPLGFAAFLGLGVTACAPTSIQPTATQPTATQPTATASNSSTARSADREIIDIHAHLGEFEGYDLSIPTLFAYLDATPIDLALVSNIDGAETPVTANHDEATANQATLELVREHPERLRGLAWARPNDGSAAALEPFLAARLDDGSRAFVGVKLHPIFNQFPADDPHVDAYLDLCARFGVVAAFHSGAPDSNAAPARIVAAAQRHPTVPVVLYHLGFGSPEAAIEAVAEGLEAGATNLYVGTAQADPDAVLDAIRTLGADRVLFGTDAAYYGREHTERVAPLLERLEAELDPADLEKVLGGTARRIFPFD